MLYSALIETNTGMDNVIFSSNGESWNAIVNDARRYINRIFMEEKVRLIHIGKYHQFFEST